MALLVPEKKDLDDCSIILGAALPSNGTGLVFANVRLGGCGERLPASPLRLLIEVSKVPMIYLTSLCRQTDLEPFEWEKKRGLS